MNFGKQNFQSSSGIVNSVNSLSLWGASTIFTFQDVQCVRTVFSWQCWQWFALASFWAMYWDLQHKVSFNSLKVTQNCSSCSRGVLLMDIKDHVKLMNYDFNWTGFATIENKFNVASVIGSIIFENVFKLSAACGSMAHTAIWFLAGCTGIQLAVIAFTSTALVCMVWYGCASMNHFSYGRRCNADWTERDQGDQQRGFRSSCWRGFFSCGIGNSHAMEDQTTVQDAFIQRMTSMAEAATRAVLAAEEALKRTSTSGGDQSEWWFADCSSYPKTPWHFQWGRYDDVPAPETPIHQLAMLWGRSVFWSVGAAGKERGTSFVELECWWAFNGSETVCCADFIFERQMRPHGQSWVYGEGWIQPLLELE